MAVEPNKALSYTWAAYGVESVVTWTLTRTSTGTHLRMEQSGPLAVIVYREGLDVWEPGAHAGTFRGNQLAMAAGLATLEFLLDNDVPAH